MASVRDAATRSNTPWPTSSSPPCFPCLLLAMWLSRMIRRGAQRTGVPPLGVRGLLPFPYPCSSPASSRHLATIPMKLSDIGEGIAEVEVLKWHVKVGQRVSQFDKLVEVQSDKATVDITSRFDGVVSKIYYKVGDMAKTGSILVDLDSEQGGEADGEIAQAPSATFSLATGAGAGAAGTATPPAPLSPTPAPIPQQHLDATAHPARGISTPAVRRIAREQGLSVASVPGTGKDGRVTKEDILKVVEQGKGGVLLPASASGGAAAAPSLHTHPKAPATAAAASTSASAAPVFLTLPRPASFSNSSSSSTSAPPPTPQPLRGIQRVMSKTMTQAWSAPHFGFSDEVCVDKLLEARKSLARPASLYGIKLTFLPILIKAASLALGNFPGLNARVEGGGEALTIFPYHNIGVAMDTPKGLLVPVIKNVGSLSILDIAAEIKRLHALGVEGALGEGDLTGCTFTLSNIGAVGGTYMSPVIPPGTVAIGAIGRVQRLPRYASTLPGWYSSSKKGGEGSPSSLDTLSTTLVPASILPVSWSADHRVVDGATMARFSNEWKGYVEEPDSMLAFLR